jgi:hypothetical protein
MGVLHPATDQLRTLRFVPPSGEPFYGHRTLTALVGSMCVPGSVQAVSLLVVPHSVPSSSRQTAGHLVQFIFSQLAVLRFLHRGE